MRKIKLLPCPFCGGELIEDENFCEHPDGKCFLRNFCFEKDDKKEIAAWNTRKPMERIVERLETMKNIPPDLEYRHLTIGEVLEIVKGGGSE